MSCKRKRTINRRVQKRLDMEQFHHFGTVFVKEDSETGKVAQKPCLFKAKFHYTGPTGPARTLSETRTGQRSLSEIRVVRVRAGPVGSGRARVVECSLYATKSQRATRQSQRLRLCRAMKSSTRATESRNKVAGVTSV